jgi:hypothetical protein
MTIPNAEAPFRALEELRVELDRATPAAAAAVHARQRLNWAIAILLAVALLGASFTPPGRALTGEIGRAIGIGDEPTDNADREAVVIGTGEQAMFRYEVVATGAEGPDALAGTGGAVTPCFSVEFPDLGGLIGATCITDTMKTQLADAGVSAPAALGLPAEIYPDAEVMVQGLAVQRVDRIVVDYLDVDDEPRSVEAQVSTLDRRLADQIGIDETTKAYEAFLPADLLPAPAIEGGPLTVAWAHEALTRVSVRALDADGAEIGQQAASASRAASSAFARHAPEARFASAEELADLCSQKLARGRGQGRAIGEEQILPCVFDLIRP